MRRTDGFTLIEVVVVTAIIGILSTMAMSAVIAARHASQENVCLANQCQIDAAKERFATDNNKPNGYNVTTNEILPYLRGNVMPVCPAGGQYILDPIGEPCHCEEVAAATVAVVASSVSVPDPPPATNAPPPKRRHKRRH
jgi:general secretion pathway protein G